MSNKATVLSLQQQEVQQPIDVDCQSYWLTVTITTVACTWSTASNNCRN